MSPPQIINVISTNNTKPTWSRQAIIAWCNSLLHSDIEKVDDLCTGAAYCCLMDLLMPDCLNLNRVRFRCHQEDDYVFNLILLQQCFKKLKVNKYIPIYKLIKGKYQDNYEFAVWFRLFFEVNFNKVPQNYDVFEKRHYQPITREEQSINSSLPPKVIRAKRTVSIPPPPIRRPRTINSSLPKEPIRVEPIRVLGRGRPSNNS